MIDPAVPLAALVALVGAVAGVQQVYTGFPSSFEARLCAAVLLESAEADDQATGLLRVRLRFQVLLTYRVKGAPPTSEAALATAAGAFWEAFYANRNLSDAWSEGFPAPPPSLPTYIDVDGQEVRMCALAVTGALTAPYHNA